MFPDLKQRRPAKVLLAASSKLGYIPETLMDFIAELPVGSRVLLRRGNNPKPGPGLFEMAMAAFCNRPEVQVDYEWVLPDPHGGREATYLRDVAITRRADVALCFFAGMHMEGGTEHIVDKALDAGTPVYSWGFNGSNFVRIGEHDPDEAWTQLVPWV